jgi:hypothetical protein
MGTVSSFSLHEQIYQWFGIFLGRAIKNDPKQENETKVESPGPKISKHLSIFN